VSPRLVLLVAVLAVSWAAILAALCAGAGPLAISFWRLAISAALLAPVGLPARRFPASLPPPADPSPAR